MLHLLHIVNMVHHLFFQSVPWCLWCPNVFQWMACIPNFDCMQNRMLLLQICQCDEPSFQVVPWCIWFSHVALGVVNWVLATKVFPDGDGGFLGSVCLLTTTSNLKVRMLDLSNVLVSFGSTRTMTSCEGLRLLHKWDWDKYTYFCFQLAKRRPVWSSSVQNLPTYCNAGTCRTVVVSSASVHSRHEAKVPYDDVSCRRLTQNSPSLLVLFEELLLDWDSRNKTAHTGSFMSN